MINANELRIGNWIKTPNGKPMCVKNILENSVNQKIDGDGVVGSYQLANFEPIPLSPDILIKNCGFIENEMYDGETWVVYESKSLTFEIAFYNDIVEMQKSYVDKLKSIRCYVTANEKYKRHEFIEVDIVSIHHVQNLIFALTGEELTINL